MKDTTFYTESKIQGYDIINFFAKEKKYATYLNLTNIVDYQFDTPKYVSREEFERILKTYKKVEEHNLINYNPHEFERFYCETNNGSDNVDLIVISANRKAYSIWRNVHYLNTDGYDVIGYPVDSFYVSKKIFEALYEGLKTKGFKKVEEIDNVY